MSKEQIDGHEKFTEEMKKNLPFRPEDDLIFYFKSISRKELEEQP